ncbi:MAG TPA: hypothetical protein VNQ90_08290 [Chthoniobacteraceae bacterium]|nr:hypothetical protein [Chthoniobacteraceae bacterium]
MKIKKILGENGPQAELCNGSGCPAAILTNGEDAYVQGYIPSGSALKTLNAPEGESFVRIPLSVLKKIAAQVVEA